MGMESRAVLVPAAESAPFMSSQVHHCRPICGASPLLPAHSAHPFSRPHTVTPKQVAQENVSRGFQTNQCHLFGSTIALPLSTKQSLMLWFWGHHNLTP